MVRPATSGLGKEKTFCVHQSYLARELLREHTAKVAGNPTEAKKNRGSRRPLNHDLFQTPDKGSTEERTVFIKTLLGFRGFEAVGRNVREPSKLQSNLVLFLLKRRKKLGCRGSWQGRVQDATN